MSRTYLVTGGTGFVGAAVTKALVARGDTVRVLDDNSRGAARRLGEYVDDVRLVVADIRDADAVADATRGVDAVLHLAYVNGTRYFYERPELVLDVGIRGMLNVIDACRTHRVGDLVVASSSEAYQTPPRVPTDEQVPLVVPDVKNPRYSYGGGKILSELMAMNYGRTGFDRVVVFRPHNVYGPDMGHEHVVPELAGRLLTLAASDKRDPLPFPLQGDGSQTRAFMHVDDCADAVLRVTDRGEHLGIYHVGNPEEVTIAELASRIGAHFGRTLELVAGPAPAGGTQRRCPDISLLRGLGFEPRIPLQQGLTFTLDWYARDHSANEAEGPTQEEHA